MPAPSSTTSAEETAAQGRTAAWRRLASPWAWRGALAFLLALLGFAASLWLPYLVVPGSPSATLSRDEVSSGLGYEREMLDWPLYACGAAAALGGILLLLGLGRIPRLARREEAGRWALAGVAACGFILALMACRWLGFQFAHLMDTQPLAHLHAAPYAILGVGGLLLGLALSGLGPWVRPTPHLAPAVQVSAWLLGASALALLLLPLLPTAAATLQGFTFHYDELSLETLRRSPAGFQAPQDWMLVRLLMEGTALLSALCLAWGVLRLPGWRLAPALLALPLAAATLFAVRFYLHVGDLPNQARPWPNPLPPLALASLWATLALGGIRALKATRRDAR